MAWRRGQAYSQDLRDRVLAAEGSARTVAAQFVVSVSYVVKVRQRRDRKGEVTPGPQRSHAPRKLAAVHDAIVVYAAEHTDATIEEFRAWLTTEHGVYASAGLMWKTLDRLGLTLKNVWPAPSARMIFYRACWSASTYPVTGPEPWPRWNARASGLIKIAVSGTTFLSRLPKRRLDRYAICLSPSTDLVCVSGAPPGRYLVISSRHEPGIQRHGHAAAPPRRSVPAWRRARRPPRWGEPG